ncbi:MAG TPA: S9 family peptidase [Acidimicrobiia bacterium]|nr:S9 family peptidase [Acidimicrobiia bacterium]
MLEPPRAARRPHVLSIHGDDRVDDWYWLRERDNPGVRAYLDAENAYADAVLGPQRALREQIFEEIRARVQETDESAPTPFGAWEYSSRTIEGQQYAVHCRRPRGSDQPSSVILDENALAAGHDFFALGGFDVTPDNRTLAYAIDVTGGERYTLHFRDLDRGDDYADVIEDVTYGLAWSDDGRTIFYVRPDDAMRPHEIWRHTLGTAPVDDVLVLREPDEYFNLGVERTRSGRFILITASSKMTTEVWFVPSDAPHTPARVVAPREQGHEYTVEHHWSEERGDRFLIVTNQSGKAHNFELVAAPAVDPARQYWTPLVPHRDDVRLDAVHAFAEHLVLDERADGLTRLQVMRTDDGAIRPIGMPEPVYTVGAGVNDEYDTQILRYEYTSLATPPTDIDYDMSTGIATVVKRQPVLGGYDPDAYVTERIWADADGTRVPISVVRRRDTPVDGTAPAVLYGYGSYETSIDPEFRASRLSLLDRGAVYAIAHVRGGGEMGRDWYEDGRLANKMHTFTDFLACADHLVASGYAAPDRLAARGGSAGGLLMGTVVNLRPDRFCAIHAAVPFVDVVTTMLDASLPLTVTEWEEWGDPREPGAYVRMKAYSPYDNVAALAYPAMLVTTGLNDARVQYWEPAKWVAKLRANTTADHPILLRTEMGAGHGGPSGRYEAWREEALVLAFLCNALGIAT